MASGNHHWSIEDVDYKQLIDKSINQVGDAMGAVFAIHGADKNQKRVIVQLDITAIDSIKKYRKAERYLTDLSAVKAVSLLQVDGHRILFEISLRSSEEDFLTLIKNDAQLMKLDAIKPQSLNEPPAAEQRVAEPLNIEPLVSLPATENNEPQGGVVDAAKEPVVAVVAEPALVPKVPVYHYKLLN